VSVDVHGSGFRPNVLVETLVCGTSTPVTRGDCVRARARRTRPALDHSFIPTPTMPAASTAGGGRHLHMLWSRGRRRGRHARHPSGVVPDSHQLPRRDRGSARAPDWSRAAVTVNGNIFDPNALIAICQAPYPFESTDVCGTNVDIAVADQFGMFQVPYTVRAR
jgi:hypothetical protein